MDNGCRWATYDAQCLALRLDAAALVLGLVRIGKAIGAVAHNPGSSSSILGP